MNLSFEFRVSIMRLYNGRLSFFAVVRLGSRRYWLQRWDTDRTRAPQYNPRFLSRDCIMGWTAGRNFAP